MNYRIANLLVLVALTAGTVMAYFVPDTNNRTPYSEDSAVASPASANISGVDVDLRHLTFVSHIA